MDLAAGSDIMIVDPQLQRALWPVGHVIKVQPRADGNVGSVDAKMKGLGCVSVCLVRRGVIYNTFNVFVVTW